MYQSLVFKVTCSSIFQRIDVIEEKCVATTIKGLSLSNFSHRKEISRLIGSCIRAVQQETRLDHLDCVTGR